MMEEVKKEMKRFYCEVNVFTYNILMRGFVMKGWLMKQRRSGSKWREELCREMGLSEIESSGVTFEHLIQGCYRLGDINMALL